MKLLLETILLGVLFLSAMAVELYPLPWSEDVGRAARFEANSSGVMVIADDAKENAVRFEVEFPPNTDRWVYPYLQLKAPESLVGVKQIRFEFRTETDIACHFAHVMFGGQKPYYNLPAPTKKYQLVTIDVASAVKDPTKVMNLQIGMNPESSKLVYFIRNLEFLTSVEPARITDASLSLVAAAPGTVFLQGEALKFQLKSFAARPKRWTLKNWKKETIRQGNWSGSELVLDTLPNGYYMLELDGFTGCRSFAVVPDPEKRPANPELYFAMDSAQSWLARPFPNNPRLVANAYEVVSEVARRAGLRMVRERLHWNEHTEPVPGTLDWQQYMRNAEYLAKRNLAISGVYHNAPGWAKKDENAMLPNDLIATYHFAKATAEAFRGKMKTWEFWNEQDSHGFTMEGAWDYAAALKAAYLGFKAGNPELSVAIGGYTGTDNFAYADAAMKSGIGGYFDIFNIHTYDPIRDYPEIMRTIRAHMKRFHIEHLPIWFTEHGTRVEGFGQLENWVPETMMHSPDQEMLLAEFIPKAMLTLQHLGVSRDFFFVLPPYNEFNGKKDWGMMRRDFTVKPGFAAFATLVDQLGWAKPEGEVKLDDGLKGYLYRQQDGSRSLVFWSSSPVDTGDGSETLSATDPLKRNFKLPGTRRKLKGVDLFGTPLEFDSMEVTATRFPVILNHVTDLKISVPARLPGGQKTVLETGIDKTVIFRTELSDDFETFLSRDCVNVRKPDAKFKLQIWNLSSHPKTGFIEVAGGTFAGVPPEIKLPPFGKEELELSVTPQWKNAQGEIRINGRFNNNKATPLVIPVIDMKALLSVGNVLKMPRMIQPENWRKNSAGDMTIFHDPAEKSIVFHTRFAPGTKDRWSYPEFLLQLPQESQENVLGIAFEVKVSDAANVQQMAMMAVKGIQKETGEYSIFKIASPNEKWESRFIPYLIPHLKPKSVRQIRIGINALSDDITISLRNIRFIYYRSEVNL